MTHAERIAQAATIVRASEDLVTSLGRLSVPLERLVPHDQSLAQQLDAAGACLRQIALAMDPTLTPVASER